MVGFGYDTTFRLHLQLRIGHFQPSIGIRYDDHTMLCPAGSRSKYHPVIIAPNFAEYGAELNL